MKWWYHYTPWNAETVKRLIVNDSLAHSISKASKRWQSHHENQAPSVTPLFCSRIASNASDVIFISEAKRSALRGLKQAVSEYNWTPKWKHKYRIISDVFTQYSSKHKKRTCPSGQVPFHIISEWYLLFYSSLGGGQYWAKYADYQLITKGLVNILNAFFAHSAHSASWHWFLTRIVFSYVITSIISLSSFLGVKLYLDNIISCLYSLWTTSLIANR